MIHPLETSQEDIRKLVGDDSSHSQPSHARMSKWNLKRQVIWQVVARFSYTVCQWLMLLSVIRLTDAATVGTYGAALAATTLVFRFSEFGITSAITTDVAGEFEDKDYVRLRLTLNAISVLLVLAIGVLGYRLDTVGQTCLVLLLPKLVESSSTLTYGMLRRDGRIQWVATSLVARGGLGAASFTFTLYITHSLFLSLVSLAIAWMVVASLIDYRAAWWGTTKRMNGLLFESARFLVSTDREASWGSLKQLFLRLWPLGVSGVLGYSLVAMPTLYLKGLQSIETVGIYTALFYPFQAANMIVRSLGEVLLQPLAKNSFEERSDRTRHVILRAIALVMLACAIGIGVCFFFGDVVLSTIYTAEYAEYRTVFTCLAVAWTIRYLASILKLIPTAQRNFVATLRIHLFAALPMVTVAPFLIAWYGLSGAVASVAICHVFFLAGTLMLLGERTQFSERSGDDTSAG